MRNTQIESGMRIKLHSRNIDPKLRIALSAMTEFALAKLLPSKRLRNNLSIDIHLKHHDNGGEAMLAKGANRYRPRAFKIVLDHHRMEKDDYNRSREDTEWGHEVLKTLAHELVHVKQYVLGDLTWRDRGLTYKGEHYGAENLLDYFDLPYEVEAYGRERGLLVAFLVFWNTIEEQFDF